MSPQTVIQLVRREPPLLREDEPISQAVREVVNSGLPALPVVNADERLVGIFGEREFMGALFPGYVKELRYAGFVTRSLESALEKRRSCAVESVGQHMNTEHVDVPPDFADVQLAETFLHHRVLIIPVTDEGKVVGVVTRSEFFQELAKRFLDAT